MKIMTCMMCGGRFEQYHPRENTCASCDGAVDEHDERVSKELADPAVKARIQAGVEKRIESP